MATFSNAQTGDKTADPYTAKNLQEPSLKEKVEDLLAFIDKTKFGMLTTQTADSDLLASRCMALAAKVHIPVHPCPVSTSRRHDANNLRRKPTASIFSSTPTPNLERLTTFPPIGP
jgi:hypothetical protein